MAWFPDRRTLLNVFTVAALLSVAGGGVFFIFAPYQANRIRADIADRFHARGEAPLGIVYKTDAAGVAGTKRVTCKSDCTWDIPNTCTPGGTQCPTGQSCTPNAVTTTRKSCGPNTCGREYEETKTCTSTGCGASVTTTQVTACPACAR